MAEKGTAVVQKLDVKKAAQEMQTVEKTKGSKYWKKGDWVFTLPMGEDNYLLIVLPKETVDEKMAELNKISELDESLKAKALKKWIAENKELAVAEYEKKKAKKYDFDVVPIKKIPEGAKPMKKPAVPATAPALAPAAPEEKKVTAPKGKPLPIISVPKKGVTNLKISTAKAKKEGADISIPISIPFAGTPLKIKLTIEVTEEDLSDKNFSKTKKELEDKVVEEAKKKNLPSKYDYGGETGTVSIYSSIQKAVRVSLDKAKKKVLK